MLDADLRDFFGTIDHEWLVKFVEHRSADRRLLRLLQKWLSAGVMEEGRWVESEQGSPQGATVSPLLANIYLHDVFDLWVQQWRKRHARGEVIVVRYADDVVVGFQHKPDAMKFLEALRDCLRRFARELHPNKTRLIAFGKFANLHDATDRLSQGRRSFAALLAALRVVKLISGTHLASMAAST